MDKVVLLTEMHGEGAPLGGGRVKISVFHVKIPRADSLRPQSEQGSEYINISAVREGNTTVFMEL